MKASLLGRSGKTEASSGRPDGLQEGDSGTGCMSGSPVSAVGPHARFCRAFALPLGEHLLLTGRETEAFCGQVPPQLLSDREREGF
jgi:hypothetical protein